MGGVGRIFFEKKGVFLKRALQVMPTYPHSPTRTHTLKYHLGCLYAPFFDVQHCLEGGLGVMIEHVPQDLATSSFFWK